MTNFTICQPPPIPESMTLIKGPDYIRQKEFNVEQVEISGNNCILTVKPGTKEDVMSDIFCTVSATGRGGSRKLQIDILDLSSESNQHPNTITLSGDLNDIAHCLRINILIDKHTENKIREEASNHIANVDKTEGSTTAKNV